MKNATAQDWLLLYRMIELVKRDVTGRIAIAHAADLLIAQAKLIHAGHTCQGKWDRRYAIARADHDDLVATAMKLRALLPPRAPRHPRSKK